LESIADDSKTYMKLSGAFSELGDQDADQPWSADTIVTMMKPWLDVIFQLFPPERIMFGSDWPVCNVRGPGDQYAWRSWYTVVSKILDDYGLDDQQKRQIWHDTAVAAYRL
jgi:L-rhamnono-1,4-lactonase